MEWRGQGGEKEGGWMRGKEEKGRGSQVVEWKEEDKRRDVIG